jgi:hypothetical protein
MMKYLFAFLLVFSFLTFAEATGDINTSLPQPIATGFYGSSVTNCTQNYGGPPLGCGTYQCFFENGTTSVGSCRPTSNTDCYESLTWYKHAADSPICKNSTDKWSCSSGAWVATSCANGCSSGGCVASATATTTASSGGTTGTTDTDTTEYLIAISTGIADFNITQGKVTTKTVTVKNTGNGTLHNISMSLSEDWASSSPSKFDDMAVSAVKTFTVTFTPGTIDVKEYTITYTVTSVESGGTASKDVKVKVLPTAETVDQVIIPKYNSYKKIIEELEKNVTELKNSGYDVTELEALLSDLKTKINQTNTSLEVSDYFNAATLLTEADDIAAQITAKIQEARTNQGSLIFLVVIAVVILAVLGVVVYMFLPPSSGIKKPGGSFFKKNENFLGKAKSSSNPVSNMLEKLKKKKKDKFKYSYGG